MANSLPKKRQTRPAPKAEKMYTRFDLSYRIEHLVFLASFTTLGITGLAQKFAITPLGETFLALLGGIEITRRIHRTAVVIMMIVSIYHVISVLYRVIVLRVSFSMFPTLDDFKHLYDDILYYIGKRKHKAFYGRYNYAEKVEYFAVVWGTIIMGLTGFMMWNPITTTHWLPGEAIPAAKAAHGGEAILAVLAIIIWHFYHVHIRQFNKSMFTGKISEKDMKHEHPAELAAIKAGQVKETPSAHDIRYRQLYFFPIAVVLALGLGFGAYKFVATERTAVAAVPPAETGPIFVPFTSTPTLTPTLTPTPTPTPMPTSTPTITPSPLPSQAIPAVGATAAIPAISWLTDIQPIFQERCGTCHNAQMAIAGMDLTTYQEALKGSQNGAVITVGDAQASKLVQIQSAGGHPGQLTSEELAIIVEWIKVGAPETAAPSQVTPIPGVETGGAGTWQGDIQAIFQERCGACHNPQMVIMGLNLTTYQDALKGGQDGPVIFAGDPQGSTLVQLQSAGGHPGQLTQDELAKIIAWIKVGAPEK
ncbi:MAG: hypothetical protein MUO64_02885 [Anaerolineales bacterium]|nr:hypothetical protein [Anaerolineales bacterium]